MSEHLNKKGILMVITLISILAVFIPPLVYWFIAKDSLEGEYKKYLVNLLNFELTLFIIAIILSVIFAPLVGLVSFINLICLIIATAKLGKEQVYKFPMTIEIIK